MNEIYQPISLATAPPNYRAVMWYNDGTYSTEPVVMMAVCEVYEKETHIANEVCPVIDNGEGTLEIANIFGNYGGTVSQDADPRSAIEHLNPATQPEAYRIAYEYLERQESDDPANPET